MLPEGVHQQGSAAARMEDIAAEAGMNRALLHYYFRSKEKMFDMIFEENLQLFYGNFLAVLQQDVPFKDKIAMLVSTEIDTLLEHPEIPLFFIVQEIARKPEQLKDKMKTIRIHRFVEEFGRQLTEETQRGNIRKVDPRQFFMSFMACASSLYSQTHAEGGHAAERLEFASSDGRTKKEVTRTLLLSLENRHMKKHAIWNFLLIIPMLASAQDPALLDLQNAIGLLKQSSHWTNSRP